MIKICEACFCFFIPDRDYYKTCSKYCRYALMKSKTRGRKRTLEFRKYCSDWMKGQKRHLGCVLSKEQRRNLSEAHRGVQAGEKNPNWKGGTTLLERLIRSSALNREWVKQVLKKYNYTCQRCNQRGGWIVAHHKMSVKKIIEFAKLKVIEDIYNCPILKDINNGICYCQSCHIKVEWEEKKKAV